MPTALTRDTTRVVSETLVASLTKQGLVLRRPRGRRKVLVTWEELEREYVSDAPTGLEAFKYPLPCRWLPAIGEAVWVKPKDTAWRGEVAKVLSGMGEEIVVVFFLDRKRKLKLNCKGEPREVRVLLSQTRPIRGG